MSVLHKSVWTTQKESGRIEVNHVVNNEFTGKASCVSDPGFVGLGKADPVIKIRARVPESLQLRSKDDVLVSRLSWKWRKRSSVKIAERTYEKRAQALHC